MTIDNTTQQESFSETNLEKEETFVESGTSESEVIDKQSIEEELAKEKDKFLRLFAEFENYKKRTSKERIELFKTA